MRAGPRSRRPEPVRQGFLLIGAFAKAYAAPSFPSRPHWLSATHLARYNTAVRVPVASAYDKRLRPMIACRGGARAVSKGRGLEPDEWRFFPFGKDIPRCSPGTPG
jgi:hypothetical protein